MQEFVTVFLSIHLHDIIVEVFQLVIVKTLDSPLSDLQMLDRCHEFWIRVSKALEPHTVELILEGWQGDIGCI